MSQTAVAPAPAPAPPLAWRQSVAYAAMSVLVGVTQGLGINIVSANLPAIQGALGASTVEGAWLLAAYFATSISASVLIVKARFQYGLRRFADVGLILFIVVTAAHLFTRDLHSAIALRAAQGLASAPLSSLSLLYMVAAFPPERRANGMALGMAASQLGLPLSRVISPDLLEINQWHGLYLLELGLALICMAGISIYRLPPPPQQMRFVRGDFLSFLLLAPGLGLLAIVLSMGRYVWWLESRWLGLCLALSLPLLAGAILLELHRKEPLLDIRWLSSVQMLRFLAALILFRIALSEQTTGAIGFMQTLGMANEQMQTLFWIILAATVCGFLIVGLTINPERPLTPLMIALVLIIAAAWADSHATSLTRPAQLYVTQAMMAFAAALFLPPAMLFGMTQALSRSYGHIVSFIMVFSAGQNAGSLIGSALLGTFVTVREKFHSNQITQSMTLADPQVVQRMRQMTGVYAHVQPDAQLRAVEGASLLQQQATREAYVLAYNDAFLLIAWIAAGTLVWMIYLRARTYLSTRSEATA